MSKKVNDILRGGAEKRWPGSGDHFVAIHEFMRQGGRENALGSAMNINFALLMNRTQALESIRRSINARAPKRTGKRMDLYVAACSAMDALETMARAEESP